MIHKHAVSLLGLLTFLAWASGFAQPSNGVESPVAGVRLGPSRIGQIGDPIPPITLLGWAKGKPVKIQPGTNIYVLVFCNLTQANEFALTNLSALQKHYQDQGLITIAISPEAPGALKAFVEAKAADIDFSVAADDLPGRTANAFLQAFGQRQLPRAFVVGRDLKLLWQGHPLTDGLGAVVDDIIAGRYDAKQTQRKVILREQMEQYLVLAREDDARAGQMGRYILMLRTNDAPGLCDFAFQIATALYIVNRDEGLANAALDRALELGATNTTDIAVDRAILRFQTGKQAEGLALARQALASAQGQEAKDEAQVCIHAMEARLAAAKTKQAPASANPVAPPPANR